MDGGRGSATSVDIEGHIVVAIPRNGLRGAHLAGIANSLCGFC